MNSWIAWLIKLLFIGLGAFFVYKGIRLTSRDKTYLANATPVGDTALGCLAGLLAGIIFAGILRLMPLWFVKLLWVVIGVLFIYLGFKLPVSR